MVIESLTAIILGYQILSQLGAWGERAEEMIGDLLEKVTSRVLALTDCVGTIRIGEHGERFIMLDQLVDKQLRRLVVAIVIAGAVDQQEFALEFVRKGDRRT